VEGVGVRVLATGTEGYIGALLPEALMDAGHSVVGVDTGFYKAGWLYDGLRHTAETLAKDIRELTVDDLDGFDAVVHMAELSNDPVGQLAPDITYDINHHGSITLASLAREAGVERFVYTSSCSIYGVATRELVDETSEVNPQTAYADCKRLVERDLIPLATDTFSPTVLRNATAYGASPRMRFDIVVNNLSGLACTLDAPRDAVHQQVFNVGSTRGNYRVREVAEIVAEAFPGCELTFGGNGADNRSYRVSFDKIHEQLPGFACDWDVQAGVAELRELFERIGLDETMFGFRGYTRLKQIRYLLDTGQIDDGFYWRQRRAARSH
jgi:nucleoside-diphosphate-sugar epimerase